MLADAPDFLLGVFRVSVNVEQRGFAVVDVAEQGYYCRRGDLGGLEGELLAGESAEEVEGFVFVLGGELLEGEGFEGQFGREDV